MPRYQKRSTKSTRLRLPRFEPTFLPANKSASTPRLLSSSNSSSSSISFRARIARSSIAIFPTAKRFWRATVKDDRGRVRGRFGRRCRPPHQFGTNTAAPRIRPFRKRSKASLAFDIQNVSVSVRTGTVGARLRKVWASARVRFATE